MHHSGWTNMSEVSTGGGRWTEGEVKAILKKAQPPRQNITEEEQKAIGKLKRDNRRIVLTADKGVSLVVMDKEDYVKEAEEFLNQPTYRTISSDPTIKFKNKLINLLKSIKTKGGMNEKGFTPQWQGPLNSMPSPRFTRKEFHWGP